MPRSPRHTSTLAAAVLWAAVTAPAQVPCEVLEDQELTAPVPAKSAGDAMGFSVAVDGNTAAVGVPYEDYGGQFEIGEVRIYERNGTSWTLQQRLRHSNGLAGDLFGWAVALEGDTLLVSAPDGIGSGAGQQGVVYVFTHSGSTWVESNSFIECDAGCDDFGYALALDGDTAVVGDPGSNAGGSADGAAYVMVRNGSTWTQEAVLVGSNVAWQDEFGSSVAVDGDTALVGAPVWSPTWLTNRPGSVYVFTRTNTEWTEQAELTPLTGRPDDEFGHSVDLEGDTALIGAPLRDIGTGAFEAVRGLAFDPDTNTLYGIDLEATTALISIDTGSGACTMIHTDDLTLHGAAWDAQAGLLYTVVEGYDSLGSVNLATGYISIVGPLGYSGVKALAMRGTQLLAVDTVTDLLLTINKVTGAAGVVGAPGFAAVRGLAYDPLTDTLYGADAATDNLVTINHLTGVGAVIGPLGWPNLGGLTFDPGTATLYGTDTSTSELLVIDTATGAATPLANLTGPNVSAGAAFVFQRTGTAWSEVVELNTAGAQAGDQLGKSAALEAGRALVGAWGHDRPGHAGAGAAYLFEENSQGWAPTKRLVASDPEEQAWLGRSVALSGPTALVGASQDEEPLAGAGSAYLFESGPGQTYCTPGTSASGCNATLSAAGAPSATASFGFALSATGVEGAKDGIYFFGTNGRMANPWGLSTSYQCVIPPVVRAGLMTGSGTTGLCDGSFSQDLNALWCPTCPKPGKNPGAGAVVQAQLWFRDPLNTSNQSTSLSDAFEFCVGP